ncbi:tyrosine-type recombinase/integrase [Thiomonas arsenitoxydans]|uniref:tyrosine-type recombinase/integrase n=1 Tax=Thiomonas arsenitoxydans (strain DSM 22701 / CIP 110005 / 3As) TaxID=426114 RepID=UPI001AC3F769|nr:integrase arm-type DNA-binding domain-containing protein [Thiomonas arsenitoxydans]MBN8776011.1 integrase arm-type DNA-binding domain-containing protein [Thiomonas arsenitoxydans]
MPLTDTTIRNAKPGAKSIKLFDERGLYLEITPPGGKLWRLKYSFGGKEKRLSFGAYPDVSLKAAREKRDDARRMLADGIDPSEARKAAKARALQMAEDSFEAIAMEWAKRHLAARSESHRTRVIRRLEREVFPFLGKKPIASITAPDILAVLRKIETRGVLDTAHRTQQAIGTVIRYAVATGRAETDPTAALRGALPAYKSGHMAAPADDPAAIGAILRAFDAFKGGLVVSVAVRMLPLLFCRPGELRTMRWEQIDTEAAQWRYTVTKTHTEHIVPLSRQALALLDEIRPLTGHMPGGWVFIGGRSPMRAMSENAINAAYRRMGIDTRQELTGHGWRAVARTFLHERLGYEPAVIEHQLAHAVPDALGTSYNRTKFLDKRKAMMQEWADYLDKLKIGAEVIPLRA